MLWCTPPWPSLTKEVRGDMGGAGGSLPMLEEFERVGKIVINAFIPFTYKEQLCLIKRIVLHCLLRHGLRDAAGGDGGDDLLPDESPHAEEYAPSPLLQSEGRGGERCAAKLDNYNLQGVSVRISGLVRRE